jgi:hypothetical protein
MSCRPPDELRLTRSFSSFTRVDANVSPQALLTAVAGVFPSTTQYANLGTFTPPMRPSISTAASTPRR